jgi:glycosyltransferase involved in cell wall biosynthesis
MADVTVIPSLEDNLPNVVLESMSCGTPVVGFDIGGIPDMVDHFSTGYVARARDVDDLMNGIQWTIDNISFHMRAKCRDKVIKCFSYRACSQRMKILYMSLSSSAV